jgi:Tfp pilus assembly protein PilV
MPRNPLRRTTAAKRRGFSLLEALLALVIFTLISFAISLALSAVFQAQKSAQRREDEASTVRAVFGFLSRDLSAAFISTKNPACVFVGNGAVGGGGGQRASNSLLTLTTLTHRIEMETGSATGSNLLNANNANGSNSAGMALPQADFMLVRYDHDPNSGMLYRTTSTVPNLEVIQQATPTPQSLLADRVVDVTLRFWDSEQQTWRTDWDYQQVNQAQPDTAQDPTQTGTDTGTDTGTQASTATGDTLLPSAVEITLTISRRDGTTTVFATTLPIVAPSPSEYQAQQNATANTNSPAGGAGTGP